MLHGPQQRDLVHHALPPLLLALQVALQEGLGREDLSVRQALHAVDLRGAALPDAGQDLVLLVEAQLGEVQGEVRAPEVGQRGEPQREVRQSVLPV